MKNIVIFLLKVVVIFIGVSIFTGLLWFPQTEGRAANLDLVSIYKDPLIIYVYLGSIPFFIVLFKIYQLINLFKTDKMFSNDAANKVSEIKHSFIILIVFISLALVYIKFFIKGEDSTGPMALGAFAVLLASSVAIACVFCERFLLKKLNNS